MAEVEMLTLQRDAARLAVRLLYFAHANVNFDTDEDRTTQRHVLEEARTLFPGAVESWGEPEEAK